MTFFYFVLVMAVGFSGGEGSALRGCDDCCVRFPRSLFGRTINLGNNLYSKYTVCSNGYMLLFDGSARLGRLNGGADFLPTTPTNVNGSAFIAPFWADNNLCCGGLIDFGLITDKFWLDNLACRVDDPNFNPDIAIVVSFIGVERFNCPVDGKENDYRMVVVSETSGRAYVILDYRSMTWNTTSTNLPPIVGYGDGKGNGIEWDVGDLEDVTTLNGKTFIFRIDEPFNNIPMERLNKGNLATMQGKYGYGVTDKEKLTQLAKIEQLFNAEKQKNENTAGTQYHGDGENWLPYF